MVLTCGRKLFAILQKYEFSSKSQLKKHLTRLARCCLRYCKSTSFQANHNANSKDSTKDLVVCDTAKVRVFKQITTEPKLHVVQLLLFAILQKYEFSSKSQLFGRLRMYTLVVCDTAKVRVFKQITTAWNVAETGWALFAILQKYEFSSKSQLYGFRRCGQIGCLRYCKSTSFQANHNKSDAVYNYGRVVCDTAKVRVFKQITTTTGVLMVDSQLFAILQKYEFSSKSQHIQ